MVRDELAKARRATVRHAAACARAGFESQEVPLTEVTLAKAARALRVHTFSQHVEGKIGADWVWWWHGGGQWFGTLVQAKRNKPKKKSPWYDFGYLSGEAKTPQVELLLAAAHLLQVPAFY